MTTGKTAMHRLYTANDTEVALLVEEALLKHAEGSGTTAAYQDRCENVPFASIGGLEARDNPQLPDWPHLQSQPKWYQDVWMRSYLQACEYMFGPDWRTIKFGWAPVLEIGPDGLKPIPTTKQHRGVYRLSPDELRDMENDKDALNHWICDAVSEETGWCVNGFTYDADVEYHGGKWYIVFVVDAELDITE